MSGFCARVLSAIVGDGVGPGEQVVQEACVRIVHVLGNLREQVLEVFIRLQTICLRRLHKAVDRGAVLGAVDGVKDMPIVAAYAERSDRSLTGGVIYGMQIAAASGRWCGAKQPRCGGSGRRRFLV